MQASLPSTELLNDVVIPEKQKRSTIASSSSGDVVEVISRTEGMDRALKGLDDFLKTFLNPDSADNIEDSDADIQREEIERHMQHLHKSVTGLKVNIEHTSAVATMKVHNHLRDNQLLLDEVNSLRREIRNLSMENQRLLATIEFNERRKSHFSGQSSVLVSVSSNDSILKPSKHSTEAAAARQISLPSSIVSVSKPVDPPVSNPSETSHKSRNDPPESSFGSNLLMAYLSSSAPPPSVNVEDRSKKSKKHPAALTSKKFVQKTLGTASIQLPEI